MNPILIDSKQCHLGDISIHAAPPVVDLHGGVGHQYLGWLGRAGLNRAAQRAIVFVIGQSRDATEILVADVVLRAFGFVGRKTRTIWTGPDIFGLGGKANGRRRGTLGRIERNLHETVAARNVPRLHHLVRAI